MPHAPAASTKTRNTDRLRILTYVDEKLRVEGDLEDKYSKLLGETQCLIQENIKIEGELAECSQLREQLRQLRIVEKVLVDNKEEIKTIKNNLSSLQARYPTLEQLFRRGIAERAKVSSCEAQLLKDKTVINLLKEGLEARAAEVFITPDNSSKSRQPTRSIWIPTSATDSHTDSGIERYRDLLLTALVIKEGASYESSDYASHEDLATEDVIASNLPIMEMGTYTGTKFTGLLKPRDCPASCHLGRREPDAAVDR
ncbi:hypothetical protein Efla_003056 [Eimeria flavescens]